MNTVTSFKTLSWMNRITNLVIGYSLVSSIYYVQDLPLGMVAVLPLVGSYLVLSSITGIGFTTFQQREEKPQTLEPGVMQLEDAIFNTK